MWLAVLALLVGGSACTAAESSIGAMRKPLVIHAPVASPGRPNVILVLTDDLSWNLVRYMPHVRALERSGTTFTRYFVVDSLCCPSRASLLTGEYPHDTGVRTNYPPLGGYRAFDRHHDVPRTFAVALRHAGYRTALMGKYLNGYWPRDPEPAGWSGWDVTGYGYPEYDYRLNEDGVEHRFGGAPRDYLTDVLARRAATFVRRTSAARAPYLLEVATFAPHFPYTPAPRDVHSFLGTRAPRPAAYDRRPTDAPRWLAAIPRLHRFDETALDDAFRMRVQAVQAVDRMLARLERAVRASGQADRTAIVFSSDNGYHLGEYRLRAGKETAFDTDIRVPLVISGPGVPADRQVTALASSVDLAPTFERLAGVGVPPTVDGTSLLPLLHGRTPRGWQRAVLVEHYRGPTAATRAIVDPDAQTFLDGNPPSYVAIRTRGALYVRYGDGEREYYDLARDPQELHNLAGSMPTSDVTALTRTLGAMHHCHGAADCRAAASRAPGAGGL